MGERPDVEPVGAVSTLTPPASAEGRTAAGRQEEPARSVSGGPAPGSVLIATGRRKRSVARVRLIPGTGTIVVNQRAYDRYFPRETLRLAIRAPLLLTHQLGKFDVTANVTGGGMTGQAGAVRLGIARALSQLDEAHRKGLRSAGLLTRDPREKERKKYGQKGARKRFQWTKR